MTNDVMITMIVGMTGEMTVGMTVAMIIGMITGMTGKGHRGHLGKKNRGLQKDPHLIMMTHSGIPNGKEWKCRKKLTHWKKEENISSMTKRKRKDGKENDPLLQKVW